MLGKAWSVKVEAKTAGLKKALEEIILSVDGLQVQRTDDSRRPDLLIFELGSETDKEFSLIHSLMEKDAVGEIFLTSSSSDPAIILKALRAGAKEFLQHPISKEEFTKALVKFRKRREKSEARGEVKNGQIIQILGSKGGVGTTTVAVNLATALAAKKNIGSIALVDMNLLFGEIPLFLEIQPGYHWGEIVKNIDRLDATYLMNILTKHPSGIYVLPSPTKLNGHGAATPVIMQQMLNCMQKMFDFTIVDGGQSLYDTSLKILEMSDIVLLISILSLPCLANTNKLLKSFNDLGIFKENQIKIVINRYLKNSEITLENAKAAIKKDIFWTIPNDYRSTISAINQGKPLFKTAPKAGVTESFVNLADLILKGEVRKKKEGIRFFS
jgi:pilus assembly protein CpaE